MENQYKNGARSFNGAVIDDSFQINLNIKWLIQIIGLVGNGSSDGSYIHLGFKPAYVLTKSSSDGTKHWVCFDNKRANNFNPQNERIMVNLSDASAQSDTRAIDFLSNGFKMRDNGTDSSATNASGSTQIYMAFAENPFVTSTGIPTTAR